MAEHANIAEVEVQGPVQQVTEENSSVEINPFTGEPLESIETPVQEQRELTEEEILNASPFAETEEERMLFEKRLELEQRRAEQSQAEEQRNNPFIENVSQLEEKSSSRIEPLVSNASKVTETVSSKDISDGVVTRVTATMNGTVVDTDNVMSNESSSTSLEDNVSKISTEALNVAESTTTSDPIIATASTLAVGGIGLSGISQAYAAGAASKTNSMSVASNDSSLNQTKTVGAVETLSVKDNSKTVSKQEYVDTVDVQDEVEDVIPAIEVAPSTIASEQLISDKSSELLDAFDDVISGNVTLDNNSINEMISILDEYQTREIKNVASPELFKEKIAELKVRISNLANQIGTLDDGSSELISIKGKFNELVNASSSTTLLSMININDNIANNQIVDDSFIEPVVITPPFGDSSIKVEFRTKNDFDKFLSENSDNLKNAKTGADLINILEFIDRVDSLLDVNVGTTIKRKNEIIISYVLNNKMNTEFLSTLSNNSQTLDMITTILNDAVIPSDSKVPIVESLSSDIKISLLNSELVNEEGKSILLENSSNKKVVVSSEDDVSLFINDSLDEAKKVSSPEELLSLLNSLSTKADNLELSQNEINRIKEQVLFKIPISKIFDYDSIMSLSSNRTTDILKVRALTELGLSASEKSDIVGTLFNEEIFMSLWSKIDDFNKVDAISSLSSDEAKVRIMEKIPCEDHYKGYIAITFNSDQLKVKYLNELNIAEEIKVDLIEVISDDTLKLSLMEEHKISDEYKDEIISTLSSDKLKNKLLNENNFESNSIVKIVSSMLDDKLKIKLMNKFDLLIDDKIKVISSLSSDNIKVKQIKKLNLTAKQQVLIVESFQNDKLKVDFLNKEYVSKEDKAKIIKSIADENTKYVETINHDITDTFDLINIFYEFKDDNLKVALLNNRFLPYDRIISLLPSISDENMRLTTYFDVMGSYLNLSRYTNDFLSSIKNKYVRRVFTDRMARNKISYQNLRYQNIVERVEREAKEMQSAYNKVNNNSETIFDIKKIKEQMQDEFIKLKDNVPFEEVEDALNNIWSEAKYYADPNGELEALLYEGWLSNVSRKDDSMYRLLNNSDGPNSLLDTENYGVNQGYFRENTTQTKFISGFIAKKYKVSIDEAIRLIERIDYDGASSYTSRMNSIFMKYMDSPDTFKKIFGFDMFVEENGRKHFNYPQLLADIYVDANIKNFSNKKLFRRSLKSDLTSVSQVYNYNSKLSVFNNYFKHNKLSLRFENVSEIKFDYNKLGFVMKDSATGKNKLVRTSSIADFKDEFINIVADRLMHGQEVTLSLHGNGSYITSSGIHKLSGNHSTTITGITMDKNSLIVSTWGKRAIVPIDDRFFKSFSIGVFDIVDTKNNVMFDPVESFRNYVSQYQNNINKETSVSEVLEIMTSIDSKASEFGIGSEFCKKVKAELLLNIEITDNDIEKLNKLPSNVNTDLIRINALDIMYNKEVADFSNLAKISSIISKLSNDDVKISQMNKYLSDEDFFKAIVISGLSSKDKIIEEYNKLEIEHAKFNVAVSTKMDELILDIIDNSPYISKSNLTDLIAAVTSDQLRIDLMNKYQDRFSVAKVIESFIDESLKKYYLQEKISKMGDFEIVNVLASFSNDPSNDQFKLDLLPVLDDSLFNIDVLTARVLATLSKETLIKELPKYNVDVIANTISRMDISDNEKVYMYFEFISDIEQKITNTEVFLSHLKDEDSKKLFNNRLGEEKLVFDYNDYLKAVEDNIDDLNSLSKKLGKPLYLDFAKIKKRMDQYFNNIDNRTFEKQFEFDNYIKDLNNILEDEMYLTSDKLEFISELESMLYEARLRNLEKRDDDLYYLTNRENNGNIKDYNNGYAENYGVNQGFFRESNSITKKIQSFVSQKYNVSLDDAMRLLERIDSDGACSYTSRMNSIFTKYMDNPNKFREIFGFDMYIKEQGRKHFNYSQMLADIYIDANLDVFTTKTSDGTRILKDNIKDITQRYNYEHDLSIFNDYFKKNNISLRFNNIESVRYFPSIGEFLIYKGEDRKYEKVSISEFRKRFIDIIEENLKKNKEVTLELSGSGSYIMNRYTHKLKGGHSTIITGITPDRRNLIVSTWGNRGIVPIDDNFYMSASLGIFDIVDDPSMFNSIDNNTNDNNNSSSVEYNDRGNATTSYAVQDKSKFDSFIESSKDSLKKSSDPSILLNILDEIDNLSLNENISSKEIEKNKKEMISLIGKFIDTNYLLDLQKNSNSDFIKLYALRNNKFKLSDKREIIQSFSNLDSMIQGMKSAKLRQQTKSSLIKNLQDDASKLKALENIQLSNEYAIAVIESLDSDEAKITAFDLTNLDTFNIALAISMLDDDYVKIEQFKNLTEVEEVSFYGTLCVLDSIKTEDAQLKALETINLSVLEKVNILNNISNEQERVNDYFSIFTDYPSKITGADLLLRGITDSNIKNGVIERLSNDKLDFEYNEYLKNIQLRINDIKNLSNKMYQHSNIGIDFNKLKEEMNLEFNRLKDSSSLEQRHFSLFEKSLNNIWNSYVNNSSLLNELDGSLYEAWQRNISLRDDNITSFIEKDNHDNNLDLKDGYSKDYGVNQGFFKECSDESMKRVSAFLVNKYNITNDLALRLMEKVDLKGACSYTSRINSIFMKYMDNPSKFREIFGFDLYVEENGRKHFNYSQLLVDIYIDANFKEVLSDNFKLMLRWYKDDVRCDSCLDLSIFNNYFKNNNIPLRFNNVERVTYDSVDQFFNIKNLNNYDYNIIHSKVSEFNEKFLTIVENYLKDGKEVTLDLSIEAKYILGDNVVKLNGSFGHSTVVTGITQDRSHLIVSTWGQRGLIPLDEAFYKEFQLGVFDIVDDVNKISSIDRKKINYNNVSFGGNVSYRSSFENISEITSDSVEFVKDGRNIEESFENFVEGSKQTLKDSSNPSELLEILNLIDDKKSNTNVTSDELLAIKNELISFFVGNKKIDINYLLELPQNANTDLIKVASLSTLDSNDIIKIAKTLSSDDIKIQVFSDNFTIFGSMIIDNSGLQIFDNDSLIEKALDKLKLGDDGKLQLIELADSDSKKIELMNKYNLDDFSKSSIIASMKNDTYKLEQLDKNHFSSFEMNSIIASLKSDSLKVSSFEKYIINGDNLSDIDISMGLSNLLDNISDSSLRKDVIFEYSSDRELASMVNKYLDSDTKRSLLNSDLLKQNWKAFIKILETFNEKERIDLYFNKITSYKDRIDHSYRVLGTIKNSNEKEKFNKLLLFDNEFNNYLVGVKRKVVDLNKLLDNMNINDRIDYSKIESIILSEFDRLTSQASLEDISIDLVKELLNQEVNSELSKITSVDIIQDSINEGFASNVSRRDDNIEHFISTINHGDSKGRGDGYAEDYVINQGLYRYNIKDLQVTDRIVKVRDFISNKYNVSLNDAIRLLERVDSEGACSYTSRLNSIFMKYIETPDKFRKIFGFDMFVEENNRTHFNYSELFADIYINANLDKFTDVLPDGSRIIKNDINSIKQNYNYETDLHMFNDYFRANNIPLRFDNTIGIRYNTFDNCFVNRKMGEDGKVFIEYMNEKVPLSSFTENFLSIVEGYLKEGKEVTIGMKDFATYIARSGQAATLSMEGEGHSTVITGIDLDSSSLVVSTWGCRALIPIDNSFYKNFELGIFDIVDDTSKFDLIDNGTNILNSEINNEVKYKSTIKDGILTSRTGNNRSIRVSSSDNVVSTKTGLVKDSDYGKIETYFVHEYDEPRFADIEYDENGEVESEDYTRLEEYLENEFIPTKVLRKIKNGKEVKTVSYSKLASLKLSEKEMEYTVDYLGSIGIKVSGVEQNLSGEFDNYDYISTYKSLKLPRPLGKEKMQEKFLILRETNDPVIRNQLIYTNMRLVKYISWKSARYYDALIEDAEQYGYEGLIKAVDTFDPNGSTPFSTYAYICIRNAIADGLVEEYDTPNKEWKIKYHFIKNMVEKENASKISENPKLVNEIVELIMKTGNVPESKRMDVIRRISIIEKISIDEMLENGKEIISIDGSEEVMLNGLLKEKLVEIVDALPEKLRKIIILRYGLEETGEVMTYDQVGKILGMNPSSVRDYEAKALRILRHPSKIRQIREFLKELDSQEMISDNYIVNMHSVMTEY